MIDLVAHMSERIRTREFSIDDYEAVRLIWRRKEGIEIAEGDDKGSSCPISETKSWPESRRD